MDTITIYNSTARKASFEIRYTLSNAYSPIDWRIPLVEKRLEEIGAKLSKLPTRTSGSIFGKKSSEIVMKFDLHTDTEIDNFREIFGQQLSIKGDGEERYAINLG